MVEMVEYLDSVDSQLMLTLNSMYVSALDQWWYMVSYKLTWIPLYLAILFAVLYRYGKSKQTIAAIFLFAIAITLTDQTCSGLLKPLVARMRPSNTNGDIWQMIHIVNGYRGGPYGFPSSHAGNSFAVMTLVMMLFRNRIVSVFFVFWAVVHSYSRIYLGVHYPGDVMVGLLIGVIYSYLAYKIFDHYFRFQNVRSTKYEIVMPAVGMTTFVVITILSMTVY